MSSIVRAVAGGGCVGAGIAIGAHSGGWFLLLALLSAVLGIGLVAGALARSRTAIAEGDSIRVRVDLIDRSAPNLASSSTLIAGEAYPQGDAPFRFQSNARLSTGQVSGLVDDGLGSLPSEALGEPDSSPVTDHRPPWSQVPAALAAVTTMWATILLPPSDVWDFTPLTTQLRSALPATGVGVDERPLWQWYDDALDQLRAKAPESLDSLLEISIYDSYVQVQVYLEGDKARTYEGRTRGWEVSEQTTVRRARDTFTVAELEAISARDFLSRAASMLPKDKREPTRMEITRDPGDIFGATRPVLIRGSFGESLSINVEATADGTVAPWWRAADIDAGLTQVGDALKARGISADAQAVKEITLGSEGTGNSTGASSYVFEFYRGPTYFRVYCRAGEFADPDDDISDSDGPRFRFSDIDPADVTRVRDDAMGRYQIDPVDRGKAEITIGSWGSDGGTRRDEIVIRVSYRDARGGKAIYSLSGDYLTEGS